MKGLLWYTIIELNSKCVNTAGWLAGVNHTFKWQGCSYSQKPSRAYEWNAMFQLQCVQPEASGSFGNSVAAWNWSLSATLVEQVKSENNYQGSVTPSNWVKPLNMPALQLADIVCNCLKWDSAQNKEQHCFHLKCLQKLGLGSLSHAFKTLLIFSGSVEWIVYSTYLVSSWHIAGNANNWAQCSGLSL